LTFNAQYGIARANHNPFFFYCPTKCPDFFLTSPLRPAIDKLCGKADFFNFAPFRFPDFALGKTSGAISISFFYPPVDLAGMDAKLLGKVIEGMLSLKGLYCYFALEFFTESFPFHRTPCSCLVTTYNTVFFGGHFSLYIEHFEYKKC